LCSRIVSRYTVFCLCPSVAFLSLTNSSSISFLEILDHWNQVGELLPTLSYA
jgi:hypothetical protein